MPENDQFQYSNFKEVFGELQSVHRIKRSLIQTVVIPSLIFFLFLGGVIAYRETRDWLVIPVCALPFLFLFCGLVWNLFSTRKDELNIYENGFTYKSGKNIEACLWSEIKFCYHRERNQTEIENSEYNIFPLGSVEKKNGEVIKFEHELPGTPEILKRFENPKSKRRKK